MKNCTNNVNHPVLHKHGVWNIITGLWFNKFFYIKKIIFHCSLCFWKIAVTWYFSIFQTIRTHRQNQWIFNGFKTEKNIFCILYNVKWIKKKTKYKYLETFVHWFSKRKLLLLYTYIIILKTLIYVNIHLQMWRPPPIMWLKRIDILCNNVNVIVSTITSAQLNNILNYILFLSLVRNLPRVCRGINITI